MRILHTARWFFPHTGGGSIRVYNIAKHLVLLGHEVHLLVHHPRSIDQCNLEEANGAIPLFENYQGIQVHRLPYFPPNFLYWSLSIPLMSRKALEIIRQHQIEVILSDNPPYLVGTAALTASKIADIPLVINVHDVWGASHYTDFQYYIGAILEKFCTRRVQRYVAVSEGLRIVLSDNFRIPKEKIGVAANAIDVNRFNIQPAQVKAILKQYPQFQLTPEGKYIIFVGIMRQWAGVQFLIKAFAKVVVKHPEYKLLLIGGGGDKAAFEKLSTQLKLKDKVIFTDSLPYTDIPAFISIAQIACAPFPSTKVTDQTQLMSPLKVLEYMAAGKAVVASRVGGMEKYISDYETGLMVTPENVDELAQKINELIEHPELVQKLGENARVYVQDEKFSWLASAKVVETALQDVLNR